MHFRNLGCFLLLLLFTACSVNVGHDSKRLSFTTGFNSTRQPRLELTGAETTAGISGTWSIERESYSKLLADDDGWLQIEARDSQGRNAFFATRPVREISGADRGATAPRFTISGDAGVTEFTGVEEGDWIRGSFVFLPDQAFLSLCSNVFTGTPGQWELLELCIARLDADYVRAFAEISPKRSFKEAMLLRRSGVNLDYLKAVTGAGYTSTTDIIRLRQAGVPSAMPSELKALGFDYTAEDIVRLRQAGVTVPYAAAWKETGIAVASKDIVKLRQSGVPMDYGKALQRIKPEWPVEEIVRLRNSGVQPDYLYRIKQTAPEFSVEEVIRLRNAGVSPDYVESWRTSGYKLGSSEIIRLRQSGVPAEYAVALNVPGKEPLAPETIIELRNRGVSPELARKLRQ